MEGRAVSRSRLILELPLGEAGRAILAYARRRGFRTFLAGEDLPELGKGDDVTLYRLQGDVVTGPGGGTGGPRLAVAHPGDLEAVAGALRENPLVLVDFFGERVIPLENLLSIRKGPGTLWVRCNRPEEVPGLLGALEHGSDAVVLPVVRPEDVDRAESYLDLPVQSLPWVEVKVRRVAPGGSGERVIVDTTSMLEPTEGILVGGQSALLLHAVSEAVGSRYTRPRPFRVNAGSLHLYTLLADGETRYLSELEPGDRVVATSPQGPTRSVRVGRLKIERRPLTLVEVTHERRNFTAFLQEAETVRLSGHEGPIPVTELTAGQTVWGVLLGSARHFGRTVEESIQER